MKVSEVLEKANRGEGLTVEEIKIYNANVKEKSTCTASTERLRNNILKSITLVNC